MNDLTNIIKERRSIRKFTSQLPDKSLIDQVIEAFMQLRAEASRLP